MRDMISLFQYLKCDKVLTQSQERHGLQVLFDYCLHNHLEDNLDVGGVGGRSEVVVDEFAGRFV